MISRPHGGVVPLDAAQTPRTYALAVLVAIYTCNFMDRSIVNTLGQAIKTDLQLSDTQLGLLSGISFAVLYSTLGIPIARLAERHNRVTIISVCAAAWSIFTVVCGFATSFIQLFLARVGVGIGEAGCSPPAQSLISDYFPPHRRSTALAIYSIGLPLGILFGALAGGWIAQSFGWRMAFAVVGAPGILLALLLRLTVREAPRGAYDPPSRSAEVPTLSEVVRQLLGKPAFINLVIGAALAAFALYGGSAFTVPFLLRGDFGLNLAQAATGYGVFIGVGAAIGVTLGGVLTDWAGKRDQRCYALIPGTGFLLAAPLFACAYLQSNLTGVAAFIALPFVLQHLFFGPTYAMTHNMVEARMRATATAILFLPATFIGLGFGPPFVGWLSDVIAADSLAKADGLSESVSRFAAMCPGGAAAAGSPAAAIAACKTASFAGLKWSIVITLGSLYPVAALFYFLAARTLRRDAPMTSYLESTKHA